MPYWNVHFDLKIDFTSGELIKLVERSRALAMVITDIPIPPYLQERLDVVNIMRAVRGTTAMEGAQVSTQEVREIMDSPNKRTLPPSRERDEQEVRNAQSVMYFIASLIKEKPNRSLTEPLICNIHKLMTKDIDYQNNTPGKYRNGPVTAADYLPPESGEEVRDLMKQFIERFSTPPMVNWDPIIRALAAHFYLISIHPFGDGNGRTSRAVEGLLLYQAKVNARGFYSLANYYYQHREEYVRNLDNVRFNTEGDLTPFIIFGLRGLASELQSVHADVLQEVKMISFRDYARETFFAHGLFDTKAGARGFHLLMSMNRDPVPMSEVYAHPIYKDIGRRTIQRDLKFLREQNLVKIQDGALMPNLDVMNQFTAVEELELGIPGLADSEEVGDVEGIQLALE